MKSIPIYLEVAPKRVFAGALDWPGWARSGQTEADAIESLLVYAPRYATAVGSTFQAPRATSFFKVVEQLQGGATTEFGAPGEIPKADGRDLDATELERQIRLLRAAWKALDGAERAASGVELSTGPRGGGRDVPKMLEHVLAAEVSYLNKLGARIAAPRNDMTELRTVALETLRALAYDEPIRNPSAARRRWPPRYFVRRAAWHALDHAWEIEDRARPGGGV